MRRLLPLLALLILSSANIACIGCTQIDAGHVGVQVENCSGGGIKPDPVDVGYHTTGPCTNIFEYPVFVQNAVWTHNISEGNPVNEEITFTNADQMQIAIDVSLAYQLDPKKVPTFYGKFKAVDLKQWTDGFLRNLAREKFDQSAGKYKIEQIMGDNSAFLAEVRKSLQEELNAYGVTLTQFGLIGAPRPPQAVIDAINAKVHAQQRGTQIEIELKQSQAEAAKTIAVAEGAAKAKKIAADAEAYSNQKLTSSLSPALIDYLRTQRWDGKLPAVQGGGASFINIPSNLASK